MVKKHVHVLQPDSKTFVSYIESPEVREHFTLTRGERIPTACDAVFCQTYTHPDVLPLLLDTNKDVILHVNGDVWYELAHIAHEDEVLDRVVTVCRKAAGVICLSRFLAEAGRRAVPQGRFFPLPRGLWGARHTSIGVTPQRFRRKTDFRTHDPLVVMQITLSHPLKFAGVPFFFEAIRQSIPRARFLNVGNQNGRQDLAAAWTDAYGLAWRDTGPDWPEVLASADIFVQASLFDTWGRSVADAMCCGLPVVAFRVGGVPEVSEDILLCDPHDPASVERTFRELLDAPSRWPDLGGALYEQARRLDVAHRYDYRDLVCRCLDLPVPVGPEGLAA